MITVLGVPYDECSSFLSGCRLGPARIREAFFCESTNTSAENEVDLADHPEIVFGGDLTLSTGVDARGQIESCVTDLLKQGHKVLALGGDHATTYPVLRAFAREYSPLNVLHFDAHPDLYDHLGGDRYSHACPFARSMEEKLVQRLVQIGIRTMNMHQREQADRFGVEVTSMRDWSPDKTYQFEGPVYLSLDLDVLDPAFVPGINHYEPGGFTTRELLSVIQGLHVELVGADIVEFNPERDFQDQTAMVAAKFLKEILVGMLK